MCGITGVAMMRREDVPLEAMNATMQHRGPDDVGIYWSPDRLVGLAQCRLAVIDLSPAARQPMGDTAGAVWVTFNGEIYNFRDLRRQLEEQGHQFRSASDTEVLIAAYLQWGEDFLRRLNGMFALALYDARASTLLLARDRAGEKPLFYRHHAGRLTFASELKAIMADPRFPRRIDVCSLDFYLAYGYVTGDRCIFEGVHKLRQGEALRFELGSGALRRWTWWNLPDPPFGEDVCADDLVREVESLLEDSVRRQLVADVPVGVLLSGGVDSSLVTAMAARVSSRPVKTFTVSFPGFSVDEGPYARIVADYFATEHTELAAEPATVELLPVLARQFDEPMADSSMVPTYLVSRLVRREATVALGGDGGDELFGGYTHYSWLLREERLRRYAPRFVRRAAAAAAARILPVGTRGRNHLIGLGRETSYSIAQVNVYFDRRTRGALLRPVGFRYASEEETPEHYRECLTNPRWSVIRRGTEADFRTTMVDGYLVKVDRASMLSSLEIRAPFLDYRLIELAFGRVPDTLKANERDRKILLRRLGRRVLPPALDLERKMGFSMPLDHWFSGDWGTVMAGIVRQSEIFAPEVVNALLVGQRRGRANANRIYALALFELWKREYGATL